MFAFDILFYLCILVITNDCPGMKMKNKLVEISDKSNIEFNDGSIEMLLCGLCRSYECDDFRANRCKMKLFLDIIESGKWEWNQTWQTPTKFFLHLLKAGENAPNDAVEMLKQLQERWKCIGSSESCNCEFFDEVKKLRNYLIEKGEI